MIERDDFELVLDRFFGEGPQEIDDRVIDASLAAIETTGQRRALRGRPTFGSMPILRRTAVVVAVAAAVVALAVLGLPRASTNIASSPSAPTPRTSPAASSSGAAASPSSSLSTASAASAAPAVLDTSGWTAYTSRQYGFTIAHPPGWVSDPASKAWALDGSHIDPRSAGMDSFMPPDASLRVSAWIVPVAAATPLDQPAQLEEWVASYCRTTGNEPCTGIHGRATALCNERRDCHPGLLVPFKEDVEGFAARGVFDGVLVMAIWRADTDPSVVPFGGATRLLEAFLSTANVVPAPVTPPADPGELGRTTFTSPQYGYTVDIPFAWAASPATQTWPGDDGIEPPDPPFSDVFRFRSSTSGAPTTPGGATIKAIAVPTGTTDAAWIAQWEQKRQLGGPCFGSATPWTDAVVGRYAARRASWICDAAAGGAVAHGDEYVFVAGGRGFIVSGTPSMVDVLVRSFRVP